MYSIDMDGLSAGAVAQTFNTENGQTYTVTFWLAANTGGPPTIKSLKVGADGTTQNYTFNDTGDSNANMGWVLETFNFTANSISSTLTFTSLDTPTGTTAMGCISQVCFGPVIDNVSLSVSAVPQPAALPIVLIAGLGLVLFRGVRWLNANKGDGPSARSVL